MSGAIVRRKAKKIIRPQRGQKPDKTLRVYVPPKWGQAYLAACLDWEIKPTISARCEAAKIDRSTYYEAQSHPEFVSWLNGKMNEVFVGEQREVRNSLLKQCLKGELEAIKLWHELYGSYIPTERKIVEGTEGAGQPGNTTLRVEFIVPQRTALNPESAILIDAKREHSDS